MKQPNRFLRGLIKTGVANTLHWMSADNYLAKRANLKHLPLVIGYHRVVDDFNKSSKKSIPPSLISSKTFEKQLDWIGRYYDFISADDMAGWMEGKTTFSGKSVASITFDDGYEDLYHVAYPILKRKGIPATVFVVTNLIGTSYLQLYDELHQLLSSAYKLLPQPKQVLIDLLSSLDVQESVLIKINDQAIDSFQATVILTQHLPQQLLTEIMNKLWTKVGINIRNIEELKTMNWAMLRELADNDIAIGSHTQSHAILTLENIEKVKAELTGSRDILEKELGRKVNHFAYPSGAFNSAIVQEVANAGYRCAYTSCQHRDTDYPMLTIPRRLWWEKSCINAFGQLSPPVMSCQVSGIFDFTTSCGQLHTQ